MKYAILTSFLLASGCTLASPPATTFSVHVINSENLIPVTNAVVKTGFTLKHDPWGTGGGEKVRFKESVDGEGRVGFEGNTIWNEQGGNVHAEGYYPSIFSKKYTHNKVLNRWEPWNPTLEIKMRPKKNPVAMVERRVRWRSIPDEEDAVGFDLEVGDWVAPHGMGRVSDLILTTSSYMQDGKKGSEARYILSFANELDGIQIYRFPSEIRSSFKWPYEAPIQGYLSVLEKYKHWDVNGAPDNSNYDDENNYIFRVRSRELEDGSVAGCYGVFKGELEFIPQGKVRFNYLFNPEVGERSLEWSGVNLLEK
jgi:hypothetical protein